MIPTLNPVTAGAGLELAEYVRLAKRNHFSAVEFSIATVAELVQRDGLEAAAAIFDRNKVLPAVFGLPFDWRGDEAAFEDGLSGLPALAKVAQDIDCCRCCTWVAPAASGESVKDYSQRSVARLTEIARVLTEQGVRFGLEFIGPAHLRPDPAAVWFYDIAGALKVVDQIEQAAGLGNVGLLVDSFHWYTSGGRTMDLASIPLEQIVHVHINDAPKVAREHAQDLVRLLPGESGVIDLVGFLKTLSAIGYLGPVAVETFSDQLRALPVEEAAARAGHAMAKVFAAAGIEPLRLQ